MVILELLQPCSLQSGFSWESKEEHWRQKNAGLPAELCHWNYDSLSVLLIGATTTWFVCSGLVPAEKLGESAYPLYDAAGYVSGLLD